MTNAKHCSPNRILLVEDSHTQALHMRILLQESGYRPLVAHNVAAAIDALAEGTVELILLDLMLPDASELEGLDTILAHAPNIPVIVLTAMDDDELAIRAIQHGAQEYLVKGDFSRQLLQRTIRYAAERHHIRRQLDEANTRLTTQNRELEQLNAKKNALLGMAAHDLRNPLGLVRSYGQFLIGAPPELLRTRHMMFLEKIVEWSDHMLTLVDDLLDVAEIEAGRLLLEPQDIDFADVVAGDLELNRVLAESKNIRLDYQPEGDIPRLWADRMRLSQAVDNLVNNAIKYSFPGAVVAVNLRRTEDEIILSVTDQGQGIPIDEQEGLFEPFQRSSVKATGGERSTGLGLAICRRIIDVHGGKLWLDSAPGRGSTFYISLPINNDTHPALDARIE